MPLSTSRLPYTRADTGRPEDLVAREHVPVAIQRLHVHAHVRHGLRAVHQHARAVAMRDFDHLPGRRDGAERVGHLREGDQPRARTEQLLILVQQHLTVIVDRRDAQPRPGLGAQLLPRHDVGVMLQPGDDDLVILADMLAPPGLGDQIDRLGGAAHEHDLVAGRRVQEAGDGIARRLVGIGGARRQFMRGAVDVGVLVLVEVRNAVDHALRFLGRRGIVQPDQRPPVDALPQNREVAAHGMDVERRMRVDRTWHFRVEVKGLYFIEEIKR